MAERPLIVELIREPFGEYITLRFDGQSEEFDPDEARLWFHQHGAKMDEVEKALDYVWNFYHTEVEIENPIKTKVRTGLVDL